MEVTRREDMEAMQSAELEKSPAAWRFCMMITLSVLAAKLSGTNFFRIMSSQSKSTVKWRRHIQACNSFVTTMTKLLRTKTHSKILFIFAKLNPRIHRVQGMDEVLASLYYVFKTDIYEVLCMKVFGASWKQWCS